MVEWFVVAGITGIGAMIGNAVFRHSRNNALWRELRAIPSIYLSNVWSPVRFYRGFQHDKPRWQTGLLIITHKRIAIYGLPPKNNDPIPDAQIPVDHLHGFWRPTKYEAGRNTIWIHGTSDDRWELLVVNCFKSDMQNIVRALKEITPPEQITAYRRQRPYIHRNPTRAFPAQQSLQGDWSLDGAVELYLNPSYLSVWRAGIVERIYNVEMIQQIAALKRMEGGKPDGLLRFQYEAEKVAFAMDDYEGWAKDLAEAARRTLEDPLIRKQKSYDEED